MSIFDKLKRIFASEPASDEPEVQEENIVPETEALAVEASQQEIALLEKLATYQVSDQQELTRNFLAMHVYRFEKPFDGVDMRTLVYGMRWAGFKFYGFGVQLGGEDHPCESWPEFMRMLGEADPEGCNLVTSFGGVRVTCTISAEGYIHMSHDSSRGVDFSPFEELFSPEEISETEE